MTIPRLIACLVFLMALASVSAFAQPAASAPASQPNVRSTREIQADLQVAGTALREAVGTAKTLRDPAQRTAAAPKAVPAMKTMVKLYAEIGQANPQFKSMAEGSRYEILSMLSLFGDEESTKALSAAADDAANPNATAAKSARLVSNWWRAGADADAQSKVIDEAETLAKSKPEDNDVASALMTMIQQGPATPALRDRAASIIKTQLKGLMADQLKQNLEGMEKLESLVNKPLTLEGVTVDGAKLSTAEWKGKVVLADFWATWCVPCVAELPEVKKVYAEYHAKGLEIVGLSCDESARDLKEFLKSNPEMKWPQLFDPASPGWHPLATQFGVTRIPTMFLIDKKGIVRTVDAGDNYHELIPKLLAE